MRLKLFAKKILYLFLLAMLLYGSGRLYYALTGGFSIANITSNLTASDQWKMKELLGEEKREVDTALSQEFTYLGKGCQSYVFASLDDRYVIKFFKHQRFRPQFWLEWLTFIPLVADYQKFKASEKIKKLNRLFTSSKIAFEHLREETGVLYVHLNKDTGQGRKLKIRDKIGLPHHIDLNQMEFILQKKAMMLCPTIDQWVIQGKCNQVDQLIDNLLKMLISEYFRGFADNDHALMQNTGVLEGRPIHIDAGQFIYNECVKNPSVFKQEIYDKTYKLHLWLEKKHPNVAAHLKGRLVSLLGIDYFYMGPYVHKGDVAKIPHQFLET